MLRRIPGKDEQYAVYRCKEVPMVDLNDENAALRKRVKELEDSEDDRTCLECSHCSIYCDGPSSRS